MTKDTNTFLNDHILVGTVPPSTKPKPKNLWSKARPKDKPYLTVELGGWTWKVLKAYKTRSSEIKDQYARWFCAVQSPYTQGGWDYGDTYIHDIPLTTRSLDVLRERQAQEDGTK